ncbi:S-4TM family putative pore-forming effector, partial [Escherichia coli]|nr:S-4TM family putative pore-forming effector [Escherichia coli]
MNAIYTNQSTRENLDLLYAQARVYDRVKNWNRLNFLFSIIVPLLLSFVTVYNRSREFVDSELLSSLLGLYGLLVLTFNAKWHLNRSQFGIRIDHDLASISDHSLASQSIT